MREIDTANVDTYIASLMPHHTDEERAEAKENLTELAGIIVRIAQQTGP